MKQRITKEQLNELSKKARRKLNDWWKEKGYVEYRGYTFDVNRDPVLSSPTDPLLSIGQMIEFLDDAGYVYFYNHPSFGNLVPSRDICNALWLAVKEVLEK